ncbi:hypothetical protein BKI52_42435 [marine bacterium AO1-C]|nr:hypothetical protein BKI52_42435 [marine bacterium AO1-C]
MWENKPEIINSPTPNLDRQKVFYGFSRRKRGNGGELARDWSIISFGKPILGYFCLMPKDKIC